VAFNVLEIRPLEGHAGFFAAISGTADAGSIPAGCTNAKMIEALLISSGLVSHQLVRRIAALLVNDRRQDSLPDWVPANHPARAILRHKAGKRRCGIDYMLVDREDYSPDIPVWECLLGTRLIGIGEVDNGHAQLFIASDGRCFGSSIVHDAFYFHADTLLCFHFMGLLGRRSRPMLLTDQQSVTLYGITFTRDSPELYLRFTPTPICLTVRY